MIDQLLRELLTRELTSHPRWAAFQAKFPGWTIEFDRLPGDESFDWRNKRITLALWLPDPLLRITHAVGHLEWVEDGDGRRHHRHECAKGRDFTAAEEREAEQFAEFWRVILAEEVAAADAIRERENAT